MKRLFGRNMAVLLMICGFLSFTPHRLYAPPSFDSPYDYNPNPNEVDVANNAVAYDNGHILNGLTLENYTPEPSTSGLASPPDTGSGGTFAANSFFDVFAEVSLDGHSYTANGTGSLSDNTSNDALPGSSTFNTQMLTLELSGGTLPSGVQIRESTNPTLDAESTGQTTVQDMGGGDFRINSFFDVFTEISLDGGTTWSSANNSVILTSTPKPSSMALIGGGALVMLLASLRRHLRCKANA